MYIHTRVDRIPMLYTHSNSRATPYRTPLSTLSKSSNKLNDAMITTKILKPIATMPPSNNRGRLEPNSLKPSCTRYRIPMAMIADVRIERNFSVTFTMPVLYRVSITAAVMKVADSADSGTLGYLRNMMVLNAPSSTPSHSAYGTAKLLARCGLNADTKPKPMPANRPTKARI